MRHYDDAIATGGVSKREQVILRPRTQLRQFFSGSIKIPSGSFFLDYAYGMASTFIAMDNQSQGLKSVLVEFNNDPLVLAVLGPVMSIDLSGAIVWRTVSLLALTLGFGSLLTIIRHTRTDEETGRSELIRACIVGRYANLTAALILTVVGNLAAGGLITLSIIIFGGAVGGSLLFGATMCVIGVFLQG